MNPKRRRLRTRSFAALMVGAALIVVAAAVSANSAPAAATATPAPFPPGAAAANARILQKLSPAARGTVHTLGLRLNEALKTQPLADPHALALGYVSQAGLLPPGGDIEEMAFVVLMDATNDQDNDLQQIMNEVQAQTRAKNQLRSQMSTVNRDVANNAAAMQATPASFPSSAAQTLKNQLDSLSDVSDATSLRLQMAMDRRSKLMATLSNLLTKISATGNATIQNRK